MLEVFFYICKCSKSFSIKDECLTKSFGKKKERKRKKKERKKNEKMSHNVSVHLHQVWLKTDSRQLINVETVFVIIF